MFSLILASSSKYRQAQLANLGIQARAIAPDIDESPLHDEAPDALAQRLALAKAQKIADANPDSFVFGSDQVAALTLDGEQHLLSKPGTYERAKEQLTLCSGQTVSFHTGIAVVNQSRNIALVANEPTLVSFVTLEEQLIRQYLLAEQPYDCAGSFKSEGKGILLFESIKSRDPNALIGLPVLMLRDLLQQAGLNLLDIATQ